MVKKKKYEDLPEIPDYERPELEKYEESDFDPTKKEREPLKFGQREPEDMPQKAKLSSEIDEGLPEIADIERPELEKYKKTPLEVKKKEEEPPAQKPKYGRAAKPGAEDEPAQKGKLGSIEKPKDEDKPEEKSFKTRKPAAKTEEFVPGEMFKLKPLDKKKKAEPEADEDVAVSLNAPKKPIKKTSTEDSADAKITPKKTIKPKPTIEENTSKDIVVKGPVEEVPIEIMITEEEDPALAEEARDTFDAPPPRPQSPRHKYDPFKYIPDKDDVASLDNVDGSEDKEVNTTHRQYYTTHCLKFYW